MTKQTQKTKKNALIKNWLPSSRITPRKLLGIGLILVTPIAFSATSVIFNKITQLNDSLHISSVLNLIPKPALVWILLLCVFIGLSIAKRNKTIG